MVMVKTLYGAITFEETEPTCCPPDVLMTYEQLGKVFGVCKDRVRQIETKAMAKLWNAANAEADAAGMSLVDFLMGES
jgi:hypothetical protein